MNPKVKEIALDKYVTLSLFWKTLGTICVAALSIFISVLLAHRESMIRQLDAETQAVHELKADMRMVQRELIRAGIIRKEELREKIDE